MKKSPRPDGSNAGGSTVGSKAGSWMKATVEDAVDDGGARGWGDAEKNDTVAQGSPEHWQNEALPQTENFW